ncbi:hypothetical protein H7Y21_00860 [Arenimonas sp.]|nr:hypothetical protein [Candidatus Parcubacteria bacterium]
MNKKLLFGLSLVAVFVLCTTNTYASSDEEETGEQHRSEVAKVVQKLEKIANEDDYIEIEVEDVAQEEKSSSEKVKEKMDAVDKRGGFKTFLIGSDYKKIEELKSELDATDTDLNKLNKALEKSKDNSIKADLKVQINELTTIKFKANDFVKNMEEKFSLFGWLVRMFQ